MISPDSLKPSSFDCIHLKIRTLVRRYFLNSYTNQIKLLEMVVTLGAFCKTLVPGNLDLKLIVIMWLNIRFDTSIL